MTNNVVRLPTAMMDVQVPFDPLADEETLKCMAKFLTLGVIHPENRSTTFVQRLDENTVRDYGIMSPLLFARVPATPATARLQDSTPIYRLFYQDARIPRCAQMIASAWLHKRLMTWDILKQTMGRPSMQHRISVRESVNLLIENNCVTETETGQLLPTRRLLYYFLETIAWMADRLADFFEQARPCLGGLWDENGGTSWTAMNANLVARELRE